jgi:hypothetical protein
MEKVVQEKDELHKLEDDLRKMKHDANINRSFNENLVKDILKQK